MPNTSFITCCSGPRPLRSAASLVLSVALAFGAVSPCRAQQIKIRPALTVEQKEAQQIEQWKQTLNRKGIGEKSKWIAQLRDGHKIKGYLSEVREEGFTLVDRKTGESTAIPFSNLHSLKRQGMPWYGKLAIVAAVFGALFIIVAASGTLAEAS